MSFFSWLRNRTSDRGPRPRSQRRPAGRRTRPQLEALEDRCLSSTLTVTSNLDNGVGATLRNEIAAAQSGDTIVFAKSLNGTNIGLSGYELYIDKNLDIEGLGATHLAILGGGARVFEVAAGVQVTLSGLTIEGGIGYSSSSNAPFSANDGKGGGILNFGTLTVSACILTGNDAGDGESSTVGNFSEGGGIFNAGTLTLSGSTVTRNITEPAGGAGGGIYNDSTGILTVLKSTVTNNTGCDLYNLGVFTVDQHSKIGVICS
jgi:hypothetical protein